MRLLAPVLLLAGPALAALDVDFSSFDSIREAITLKAEDVMGFYHGHEPGNIPGRLPDPYFWWQAGALWGTMLDYWRYTDDAQYNDVVYDSLLAQAGLGWNYLPVDLRASIGNDDQSFWGMSAIAAAELSLQDPPPDEPQWLALAQAVHNEQTTALDLDKMCGGGVRWQGVAMSSGYDYKNSIANGAYFNIAARLARFTGHERYAQRAERVFVWMLHVGLIDAQYNVWDGAHALLSCRDINRIRFSYNAAIFLQGAAYMWDLTGDPMWATHVDGLLKNILTQFFPEGIMWEPACEGGPAPLDGCTNDMRGFKGYTLRWLATAAQLCPWTQDLILPVLQATARAAAAQCTGGDNGRMCGMYWRKGWNSGNAVALGDDGDVHLGQEASALAALMTGHWAAVLAAGDEWVLPPPLSTDQGATSQGDEHAGERRNRRRGDVWGRGPVSNKDVAVAAMLTVFMLLGIWLMFLFMCVDGFWERKCGLSRSGGEGEEVRLEDSGEARAPAGQAFRVNGVREVALGRKKAMLPSNRHEMGRGGASRGPQPGAQMSVADGGVDRAGQGREGGRASRAGKEAGGPIGIAL